MMKTIELPELTFDEERHVYRLRGMRIPSVTTLMRPLSEDVYGSVDPQVLQRAAERGTAVHNAIETYVKFGVEDIEAEYEGYFRAFLRWREEHDVKPYGSEVRLYHPSLLYAGTADMLAETDGLATLIDFKTSFAVNEMLCGVQLEAYARALHEHTGEALGQKVIVHLRKDGTYGLHRYETHDTECWRVFTALLTVEKYKERYRRRERA